MQNSTLKKISDLMKHFNDLQASREFNTLDFEEINKIIRTDTIFELKKSPESIEIIRNYSFMELEESDFHTQNIQKKFLETHNGGFKCIGVSRDGNNLVTGSEDSTVRVWNLAGRKQIACLAGHKSEVRCLALLSDFSLTISGSLDGTLIVWDMRKYRWIKVLYGHCGPVFGISFSEDEKFILSGGRECEVIIWSLSTYEILKKISTLSSVLSIIYKPSRL